MATSENSKNVTFTTSGTSGSASTDNFSIVYNGATQATGAGNPGVLGALGTLVEFMTPGLQGNLVGLLGTVDYVDGPGVNATLSTGILSVGETYNDYVGGTLDITGSAIGALSGTHIYIYGGTLTADSSAAIGALDAATITVDDGGVLSGAGTDLVNALSGSTIAFGSNGGTITSDALSGSSLIDLLSSSTVENFNSSKDVIDFENTSGKSVTSYSISTSGTTSTITLFDGTTAIGEVALQTNSTLTAGTYSVGSSGPLTISEDPSKTGFQITAAPSTLEVQTLCFLAGTLITTPDGEVEIETLRPGDLVITAEGRIVPVRWLGIHSVCTRFAGAARSIPICIKAGALGDDLPKRDLMVSPDHALLLDGVLVQAGALVNGETIYRETRMPEFFLYYHVEVAAHDLILAEGVPAETLVDNVSRMNFDNWDEFMELCDGNPPTGEMDYPRAKAYRQVPSTLRAKLDGVAAQLREMTAA